MKHRTHSAFYSASFFSLRLLDTCSGTATTSLFKTSLQIPFFFVFLLSLVNISAFLVRLAPQTLRRLYALPPLVLCVVGLACITFQLSVHITVFLFLVIGIALSVWISTLHRLLEKRRQEALQRIIDVCRAVTDGAVSVRLQEEALLDAPYLTQLREVYQWVNILADKPQKDVQEMKRLVRVRSEFLANVSHELRTPIFTIQGFLETLLDGALDDPGVRKQFIEKAFANTQRLNILLSDLIDITRIESGEMRLSFRYFDMIPLVREIMRNLEQKAHVRSIELRLQRPDDEFIVYGDRDRLTQVMINLIENAIKYNVDRGTVAIILKHQSPGGGLISVEDTGIGIALEHQQRIFERFYRVDKGRSRAVGGTGLGLAIVKHILEAHKSSITLQSDLGKGTTISFTLQTED